ncbi:GDNF family receptor alpha-like, partial [Pseudolycoriella hygida]
SLDNSPDPHSEIIRIHFQSTCHTALDACREDPSCATSVEPVLMHCDLHRCNRNACMDALQSFYRASHEDLSLDVAFCLCKKTSNRHDVCMIAQEKLHPVCAQRPPDIINSQTSNGAMYHPPPACHIMAVSCKEDEECRGRLENYEQACAVDSVTKKCAGRASSCRSAMLGILGTPLRTSCACQGTEVQQLYKCMGWHRLLWLNPCVETALDNNIEPPSDSMPETLLYNGNGNINESGGIGGSGEQHLIYSLDDAECSELCSCGDTLTLTCHALCVPFNPCRTALAFYSHASPAYQAFRGRCLCYSGKFICMRPPPGEYSLPGGVFLMLGYSSTDEALLRPYTNLGVQDTIRGLQHYVNKHIENQERKSSMHLNFRKD